MKVSTIMRGPFFVLTIMLNHLKQGCSHLRQPCFFMHKKSWIQFFYSTYSNYNAYLV